MTPVNSISGQAGGTVATQHVGALLLLKWTRAELSVGPEHGLDLLLAHTLSQCRTPQSRQMAQYDP